MKSSPAVCQVSPSNAECGVNVCRPENCVSCLSSQGPYIRLSRHNCKYAWVRVRNDVFSRFEPCGRQERFEDNNNPGKRRMDLYKPGPLADSGSSCYTWISSSFRDLVQFIMVDSPLFVLMPLFTRCLTKSGSSFRPGKESSIKNPPQWGPWLPSRLRLPAGVRK